MRKFITVIDAVLAVLWPLLRLLLRLLGLLARLLAAATTILLIGPARHFAAVDRTCRRFENWRRRPGVRRLATEGEHQYHRLLAMLDVSPPARRWFFLALLLLWALLYGLIAVWTDDTRGLASWYGPGFYGRKTASGEILHDDNSLTAAHRRLPLGTVVTVVNQNNGRKVKVRINDRGPYIRGRVIDLSRAAAERLGIIADGTAPVVLEVNR